LPLTGKQRHRLCELGQGLEPVLTAGYEGATPELVSATEQALNEHELIKVKIEESRDGRHAISRQLAAGTGAELVELVGRTVLLFKKRQENSKFADL
jgi:RNA-binding protein